MSDPDLPLDEYYMNIANAVAVRGTCPRRQVGAVLVRDDRIIATGFNGAPRRAPECREEGVGCLMIDGHCRRTVHAEVNALFQAGLALRRDESPSHHKWNWSDSLYTTTSPCLGCAQLIVQARVSRVVYAQTYHDTTHHRAYGQAAIDFLNSMNVIVVAREPSKL